VCNTSTHTHTYSTWKTRLNGYVRSLTTNFPVLMQVGALRGNFVFQLNSACCLSRGYKQTCLNADLLVDKSTGVPKTPIQAQIYWGGGVGKYTQPLFYAISLSLSLSLTLTSLANLHLLICALSFRFNTICIHLSFFSLEKYFWFRAFLFTPTFLSRNESWE
jgi:hypothetical protein